MPRGKYKKTKKVVFTEERKRNIGLANRRRPDKKRPPQDWLNIASDESITSIESKGKTYIIKISPEDFAIVGKYRWWLTSRGGYMATLIKGKRIRMHRLILGHFSNGKQIDHINRDKLDNRRSNLRFVTPMENAHNNNCRGAYKYRNSWRAYLGFNYKLYSKGKFKTKEEALMWRKQLKDKLIEEAGLYKNN